MIVLSRLSRRTRLMVPSKISQQLPNQRLRRASWSAYGRHSRNALAAFAGLLLLHPSPVRGQDALLEEWNSPAALDLVQRGIDRRSLQVQDSALQTYSARGDGFVYFLLDAPEAGRQSLVRTDQVAVDVHWRAPDQVRQRIVGLREQRELPVTRLYYYLDRLTVVQDNFGQAIVIADGENVRNVPHPIGEGAIDRYDYRLADSLTLRLGGVPDPVRVNEVQVRPKDDSRPAVMGSVFLEAGSGALVRMTFTFTASAYVDPRLDYINVTLENGLWRGRYWLPHEQRLEIRREMPELDLPFGTVIRTRMRIGHYRFNEPVPEELFNSRLPITIAPVEERQNFPFERPIHADWDFEGLGLPLEIGEIRRTAQAAARQQVMTGLPATRLSIGTASEVARYNRGEGPAFGVGVSVAPMSNVGMVLGGGWAFGAEQPTLSVDASRGGPLQARLAGYVNRSRDVGGLPHTSGAANTLASLFLGQDWTDPFYVSGAEATLRLRGAEPVQLGLRAELQRSAALTTTYSLTGDAADLRPVREIDRGSFVAGTVSLARGTTSPVSGWWGNVDVTVGRLAGKANSFDFGRADVSAGWSISWPGARARLQLVANAGVAAGTLPRQELTLIGGRGTLPGFDHRSLAGDRYVLLGVFGSVDVWNPWLRARAFGTIGGTQISEAGKSAAAGFGMSGSDGEGAAIGVGVGLFYDLLRVDVARGIGRDGRVQLIIDFAPEFWQFL